MATLRAMTGQRTREGALKEKQRRTARYARLSRGLARNLPCSAGVHGRPGPAARRVLCLPRAPPARSREGFLRNNELFLQVYDFEEDAHELHRLYEFPPLSHLQPGHCCDRPVADGGGVLSVLQG